LVGAYIKYEGNPVNGKTHLFVTASQVGIYEKASGFIFKII
jgi:hypothetical protein